MQKTYNNTKLDFLWQQNRACKALAFGSTTILVREFKNWSTGSTDLKRIT